MMMTFWGLGNTSGTSPNQVTYKHTLRVNFSNHMTNVYHLYNYNKNVRLTFQTFYTSFFDINFLLDLLYL